MVNTVVRAYGLEPSDIVASWSAHPDGEVVVWFGETITLQGPPDEMVQLLKLAEARIASLKARSRNADQEPF